MNFDEILTYLNRFAYPVVLTGTFLFFYTILKLKVKRIELKRISSIKKRKFTDAVETTHPDSSDLKAMKAKGVEGLENRFAVINKSLPIILLFIWAALIAVPYIGRIPTVYVTIIAAISSVIVGMSLRPFLENLFAGIVISFFRSIRIGDTVIIDGHYGIIEEIAFTYSILKRWDWYRIVIPNSKLLNKEVENLTLNDKLIWSYVEFYVEPNADIAYVEKIAKEAASNSPHLSSTEPPAFWVMGMDKESIKCWVAAWADSPLDAWELRNEMRTKLIKSLQKAKIAFNCHKIQK